ELAGVEMTYETSTGDIRALEGIDFAVASGEFLSVVGPSGCGKSTLLALVSGLELPTRGTIKLSGRAIDGPVTDVGIVFQTAVWPVGAGVLATSLIHPKMRGLALPLHARKERGRVPPGGLSGFEENSPYDLPGGMRRRVPICRAPTPAPPLLLMDEPFGAL